MKRNISITIAALLILVLALGGCSAAPASSGSSSAAGYKDGTYKAAYDNFDSHGWKAQIEITVKDGKIATANFDYVNKDGKLKTQDADYNTAMKAKNNTCPSEYSPKLNEALVKVQDADKVEVVSGATTSSNNFKALAKAAIEKAKTGDTSLATLPTPKE